MNDQATIQTECLSADTMRSYWQGLVADHEVESIEQHLQNCPQCMDLFKRFENANEQVDILRDLFAADIKLAIPHQGLPDLSFLNERSPATHARSPEEYDEESDCYPWRSWLPPTKLIGPYRVLRTIGHGGMGAVVLAEHVHLRRQFAMKLLYVPRSFSRAQSRFKREAEAIGRLHHPSIVTASDAGQEGSLHYLVMEYVDGFDLSKLSRLIEDFSVNDVSEIGRQIALALAYAHEQGLVHRDIKPSNIMLDADGRIKLLDFGLVQLDRWNDELSELTSVGQFLGTLDYMAPEQAERAGQVDHRADLYGLGATMFRLLCGRAPLATTPHLSPLEKLRLLAHHAPPSLRTMRNDAPEELVQIVDRLLATDPNNRPLNAESVAEQLTRLAEGSNLRRLIELGRASQSVEESPVEPTHDSEKASANVPDATPATQVHTIPTRPPNRWRRYGGLVALGLLPIAFVAGILLQIPVEEGMLLIESELPEGELKIVRSKDGHEQRLKVDVGPQVTKLLAGKYSLELNSPSDSVSIENDTFVVSKGQTVVAKVRLKRNEASEVVVDTEPKPAIPTPATSAIEARFQGKNLTEWLEIYERQKAGKLPYETAQALVVLLGPSAEQPLFEELFKKLIATRSRALKNWGDPRVADAIFSRFDELEQKDKKLFLRSIIQMGLLSGKQLAKIAEWIEIRHQNNESDAQDWYIALTNTPQSGEQSVLVKVTPYLDLPRDFLWLTELESVIPKLLHRYDGYYLEHILWQRLDNRSNATDAIYTRPKFHSYLLQAAKRILKSNEPHLDQRVSSTYVLMNSLQQLPDGVSRQEVLAEYRYLLKQLPTYALQPYDAEKKDRQTLYSGRITGWALHVTPSIYLLDLPVEDLNKIPHVEFLDLSIELMKVAESKLKEFDFDMDSSIGSANRKWAWSYGVHRDSTAGSDFKRLKRQILEAQATLMVWKICDYLISDRPMAGDFRFRDFKRYLESLEEWRDLLRKANKEQDGVIANSDLQDKPEAIELLKSKGFTIPLDQPVNLASYLETKYRDQ